MSITSLTVAQAQVTPKKVSRIGLQVGINTPTMVFTKISDQSIYPDLQSSTRVNTGIYS